MIIDGATWPTEAVGTCITLHDEDRFTLQDVIRAPGNWLIATVVDTNTGPWDIHTCVFQLPEVCESQYYLVSMEMAVDWQYVLLTEEEYKGYLADLAMAEDTFTE